MAKQDLFDKWVEAGEIENNLAIIQFLSMQGKSMEEIASVFGIPHFQENVSYFRLSSVLFSSPHNLTAFNGQSVFGNELGGMWIESAEG